MVVSGLPTPNANLLFKIDVAEVVGHAWLCPHRSSPLPRKKSGVAPTRTSVVLIHASRVKSSCTGRLATVPKANPVEHHGVPRAGRRFGVAHAGIDTHVDRGNRAVDDGCVAPRHRRSARRRIHQLRSSHPPRHRRSSPDEPDIPPVVDPPAFPPDPLGLLGARVALGQAKGKVVLGVTAGEEHAEKRRDHEPMHRSSPVGDCGSGQSVGSMSFRFTSLHR